VRLHEPHLVLDRVEAAHGDEAGLAVDGEGRPHEVGEEGLPVEVRDLEDLAGRGEVTEETVARLLHLREGGEAARILGGEEELGLPVVIGGAQEAVHGRPDVAPTLLLHPAREVAIAHRQPLAVPALLVAGDHPRGGLEALAHGAPALLRLAEAAAELIGEPRVLRPVMPPVRLVVGQPILGDLLDQVVFLEHLVVAGRHGVSPCRSGCVWRSC